jgi:hypothetical protein
LIEINLEAGKKFKKMKIEIKRLNLIILIILSSIILTEMVFLKPHRYGDGNEYYLMLISLNNHHSPDLQEIDVTNSYTGEFNVFGEKADPYWGYFKGRDNKWYSKHFWGYSLSSVPVKTILQLLKLNPGKSFQITNAFLFILMLLGINFSSRLEEGQKLLFMLLLSFSPALWFIHWTHPEIFILSLVTFSLICLNLKSYGWAILFAGTASLQNQALALFVLFLLIRTVWSSRFKLKALVQYGAISLLVFLPNIFYLFSFGTFNPLNEAASLKNISAFRIFELFFDLNIGVLPYLPLSLLLFLGIVLFQSYRHKGFVFELQILLLIIAMGMVCSATDNWNHGTSGPSRYVIWMLPFLFFIIVMHLQTFWKSRVSQGLLLTTVVLQFCIVFSNGIFIHEEDYLKHSAAAEFVLKRFPAFYNPSFEIFYERTQKTESGSGNPTIYRKNNECRKALLTCEGLNTLQSLCHNTDKSLEDYCNSQTHREQWFYVNY